MIDFEIPQKVLDQTQMLDMVAAQVMRPHSRYYDEHEHEIPREFVDFIWPFVREQSKRDLEKCSARTAIPKSTPDQTWHSCASS